MVFCIVFEVTQDEGRTRGRDKPMGLAHKPSINPENGPEEGSKEGCEHPELHKQVFLCSSGGGGME